MFTSSHSVESRRLQEATREMILALLLCPLALAYVLVGIVFRII